MNFPIEPNHPVFLLMQLLTILSQGEGKGGELPASLKDASKLFFVPPDQKISFTPEHKIVPILRSFQKKLEKVVEPLQKPNSESIRKDLHSSGRVPASKSESQRQDLPKTTNEPKVYGKASQQSPAFVSTLEPSAEKAALRQLVDEVKQALRLAEGKASIPQEAPRIKSAAEKLMPLLDRLLASEAQKRAVERRPVLNFTADRTVDLPSQTTPGRVFAPPQEFEGQELSLYKQPASRLPPKQFLDERSSSSPPSSKKEEETKPSPPPKSALPAQEIVRNAPFVPAAAAAAVLLSGVSRLDSRSETTQIRTDTDRAVFPVPFFAQPVLSSARKRKNPEEEKKEREEEDEEFQED